MVDDRMAAADRALEEVLDETGARDPREFYRERLRELKAVNPDAYESAVAYYRDTLIPEVADGERHPLDAWTEYGRQLAAALAPGRTVAIDETGLAHDFSGSARDRLVLHLPKDHGVRALLVGLPPELTDAQQAAYRVLVEGKQRAG